MKKIGMLVILLLMSAVPLHAAEDHFDYVAFNKVAIVHLDEESAFMDALDGRTQDQLHLAYGFWPVMYDQDISKLDYHLMSIGMKAIDKCAHQVSGNADDIKRFWQQMADASGNNKLDCGDVDASPVSLVSGYGLARVSKVPLLGFSLSTLQLENPDNFNPTLSALIQIFRFRLSTAPDAVDEQVVNTILQAARTRPRLGQSLSVDFPRLLDHFSSDPKLREYLLVQQMSPDDRKAIHLLAECVRMHADLHEFYGYLKSGQFPDDAFFIRNRCLRSGEKIDAATASTMGVNPLLTSSKKNFVLMTRALLGESPLLLDTVTKSAYAAQLAYFDQNVQGLKKWVYSCVPDKTASSLVNIETDVVTGESIIPQTVCPDSKTVCKWNEKCYPQADFGYRQYLDAYYQAEKSILDADDFVNNKYASIENGLRLSYDPYGYTTDSVLARDNFKGLSELTLAQRLVLAHLFEKSFLVNNQARIQVQNGYLCQAIGQEVVGGNAVNYCDSTSIPTACAGGLVQGIAMGEALGLANGVSLFVGGPAAKVAKIGMTAISAKMMLESYISVANQAGDFLTDYTSFVKNRDQMVGACQSVGMIFQMAGEHAFHKFFEEAGVEGNKHSEKEPDPEKPKENVAKGVTQEPTDVNGLQPQSNAEDQAPGLKAAADENPNPNVEAQLVLNAVDSAEVPERPPLAAENTEPVSRTAAIGLLRDLHQKGVDLVKPVVETYNAKLQDLVDKIDALKEQQQTPQILENERVLNEIEQYYREKVVVESFKTAISDPNLVLLHSSNGWLVVRVNEPGVKGFPAKTVAEVKTWENSLDKINVKLNGKELTNVEVFTPFLDPKKSPTLEEFEQIGNLIHPDERANLGSHEKALIRVLKEGAIDALEKQDVFLGTGIDEIIKEEGEQAKESAICFEDPAISCQRRMGGLRLSLKEKLAKLSHPFLDQPSPINPRFKVRAIASFADLDPTVEKLSPKDDIFLFSSLDGAGAGQIIKDRMSNLDPKSPEFEINQKLLDRGDFSEGGVAIFSLLKSDRASAAKSGKPILDQSDMRTLGDYWSQTRNSFALFKDVNDAYSQIRSKIIQDYTGESMTITDQYLGGGSQKSAYLFKAGEINGHDVPEVVKIGVYYDDKNLKSFGISDQQIPKFRQMEADLNNLGINPEKWWIERGFSSEGLSWVKDNPNVPAKIHLEFKSELPAAPGEYDPAVVVQLQEYVPPQNHVDFILTATPEELVAYQESRADSDSLIWLRSAQFDAQGNPVSVYALTDGVDFNRNYNKKTRVERLFDIGINAMTVQEVGTNFVFADMARRNDLREKHQDYSLFKTYFDRRLTAFEKAFGEAKGRALFQQIMEHALEKAREYEKNPKKSLNEFYLSPFSAGAMGYVSENGIMAIMAEDGTLLSKYSVFEETRKNLEQYLDEKPIPDKGNGNQQGGDSGPVNSVPVLFQGTLDQIISADPSQLFPQASDLDFDAASAKEKILGGIKKLQSEPVGSTEIVDLANIHPFDASKGGHAVFNGMTTLVPVIIEKTESGYSIQSTSQYHWITGEGQGDAYTLLQSIIANGFIGSTQGTVGPNAVVAPRTGSSGRLDMELSHYAISSSLEPVKGDRYLFEYNTPIIVRENYPDWFQGKTGFIPYATKEKIVTLHIVLSEDLTSEQIAGRKKFYSENLPAVNIDYSDSKGKLVEAGSPSYSDDLSNTVPDIPEQLVPPDLHDDVLYGAFLKNPDGTIKDRFKSIHFGFDDPEGTAGKPVLISTSGGNVYSYDPSAPKGSKLKGQVIFTGPGSYALESVNFPESVHNQFDSAYDLLKNNPDTHSFTTDVTALSNRFYRYLDQETENTVAFSFASDNLYYKDQKGQIQKAVIPFDSYEEAAKAVIKKSSTSPWLQRLRQSIGLTTGTDYTQIFDRELGSLRPTTCVLGGLCRFANEKGIEFPAFKTVEDMNEYVGMRGGLKNYQDILATNAAGHEMVHYYYEYGASSEVKADIENTVQQILEEGDAGWHRDEHGFTLKKDAPKIQLYEDIMNFLKSPVYSGLRQTIDGKNVYNIHSIAHEIAAFSFELGAGIDEPPYFDMENPITSGFLKKLGLDPSVDVFSPQTVPPKTSDVHSEKIPILNLAGSSVR